MLETYAKEMGIKEKDLKNWIDQVGSRMRTYVEAKGGLTGNHDADDALILEALKAASRRYEEFLIELKEGKTEWSKRARAYITTSTYNEINAEKSNLHPTNTELDSIATDY